MMEEIIIFHSQVSILHYHPPVRSTTSLIGSSWTFYRRQPALNHVGFWLLFLPLLATNILLRLAYLVEEGMLTVQNETAAVGFLVLTLGLGVVMVWGTAGVLVIGKRQLKSSAGRTRTSFKAVARQARPLVIPLILTGLLRGALTILWGLLLVVPGIYYSLSTTFYPVVLAVEGKSYRAALRQSRNVLRGQWWPGIIRFILLSIFLFVPPYAIFWWIDQILPNDALAALITLDFVSSAVESLMLILFTLAMIALYGELKKK